MHIDNLVQLVQELELNKAFDNIEAEDCAICCLNTNGGTSGC